MKNFSSFLGGTPNVLLFLEADKGGPAGGGGAAPLPATFPEPEGDTPESKFANLLKSAKDYFKQLSGAMRERDDEVDAHGKTKDALKKEQDGHTATKGALKREQDDHTATKGALKVEQDAHVASKGHIRLIESYLKHLGHDLAGVEKFKAVKETPGGGPQDGDSVIAEYKKLKSARAKAKFRKDHKAEIDAYLAQPGDE
jgi:hypothetical protein